MNYLMLNCAPALLDRKQVEIRDGKNKIINEDSECGIIIMSDTLTDVVAYKNTPAKGYI